MELFGKYWEATAPLGNRGDHKVLSAGEAARTLEGDPMKFSAVLEFETYGKALSYYDSTDYKAAYATMGPDVKLAVERNIVVVKGFEESFFKLPALYSFTSLRPDLHQEDTSYLMPYRPYAKS